MEQTIIIVLVVVAVLLLIQRIKEAISNREDQDQFSQNSSQTYTTNSDEIKRVFDHGSSVSHLDPFLREDLAKLILTNQKVRAVKRLRTETGMGLIECKSIIDEIERETRNQ